MSDIKECYVCMEACDNLSSCDCKNMYIHKECQLIYITKKDNYNCSICNKPYTNIVYIEDSKKYYTSFFYIKYLIYIYCIIFNLILIGLCSFFVYNCYVIDICDERYGIYIPLLAMLDTVIICSIFIYRLYLSRNNIEMIKIIKKPSRLSIV